MIFMNKKILEVQNITKNFGGLVANDNINIHLYQGEILGLIGANGAGKTTLFNIIAGTFPPSKGSILYEGKNIENKQSQQICKLGIARTYQIVKPFGNLTVQENVMVGAFLNNSDVSEVKEKAEEIINFVGLSDKIKTPGSDLNLPQLKRLEVARALATNPKILLLDEVMAGLNPSENKNVVNLVLKIRDNGVSIILIEHVMKAVMSLSDRIYTLNQGKLIAEGTPEEIVNNPAVQASYLGEKK